MSPESFNDELLQYLRQSPTPFHAVANMTAMLDQAGFRRLDESAAWNLQANRGYYVVRNGSALIAFKTGTEDLLDSGIRLTGAHTDSPCLKVKPAPEITKKGYLQLGVEVYGGALLYPWFDRDLSLAGRVDFETGEGELKSELIDLKEPVGFIPSLAIHLDRTANQGHRINQQTELPPIFLQLAQGESFSLDEHLLNVVRKQGKNRNAERVLSHELFLYDTQPPGLVGLRRQFIASARLDNLLSCFITCKALIESEDKYAGVLVCNDHEEVGSASAAGAQGPFLKAVLARFIAAMQADRDGFERVIHRSVLLSVDNAHGVHPNYGDKHDNRHSPLLNKGPVIKVNANQRYASNSQSVALFKSVCNKLDIPYQSFVTRSDLACGSTIGPLTATELGVMTADIGIASFGMHSIRELAGVEDAIALATVMTAFYNR